MRKSEYTTKEGNYKGADKVHFVQFFNVTGWNDKSGKMEYSEYETFASPCGVESVTNMTETTEPVTCSKCLKALEKQTKKPKKRLKKNHLIKNGDF